MPSARGTTFTCTPGNPVTLAWVDELNAALIDTLALIPDDVLEARLRADGHRGVFIRRGRTVAHGQVLAAYWGHLTLHPPRLSRYLLQLPDTYTASGTVAPYVDAHSSCTRTEPPPYQAALLNHQCENPTCSAQWRWPSRGHLPIMVAVSRSSLRGCSELTYNYDSYLTSGAYTLGAADAALATLAGRRPTACGCSHPGPCPRNRYMP